MQTSELVRRIVRGVRRRLREMNRDRYHYHKLVLPSGETEESLFAYLSGYIVEDAPRQEMKNYLYGDFKRFLYTLSILPDGTGKLLEIGANPYFMSMLLRKYGRYDLNFINYFSEGWPAENDQSMISDTGDKVTFHYSHINIESQRIPMEDHSFDVILMCEVIEHMTMDPMIALLNIKNALKTNGYLLLTTPNVNRLENVSKMMAGVNIYDPYSKYGIYGRHNREYTKEELLLLLAHMGFDVDIAFTSDVNDNVGQAYFQSERFIRLLDVRKKDLGQYIFLRAKNVREAIRKRPSWLYRSYSADEVCD